MGRTVVRCDYITLEPLKLESVDRSEEEAYGEMLELVQSADGMERLTERLKEQLRLGAAPYLVGPHASEVVEAVCCDEIQRIGTSIAEAQGLAAASVRVKAGVAGTYWRPAVQPNRTV